MTEPEISDPGAKLRSTPSTSELTMSTTACATWLTLVAGSVPVIRTTYDPGARPEISQVVLFLVDTL